MSSNNSETLAEDSSDTNPGSQSAPEESGVDDILKSCNFWIQATAKRSQNHKASYRVFIRFSSVLFGVSIIFSAIVSGSLFSSMGDEEQNERLKLASAILAAFTAIADGLNKVVSLEAEKHRSARLGYVRIRRQLEHLLLKYPVSSAVKREVFLEEYLAIEGGIDEIMREAPAAMTFCSKSNREQAQRQNQGKQKGDEESGAHQ